MTWNLKLLTGTVPNCHSTEGDILQVKNEVLRFFFAKNRY